MSYVAFFVFGLWCGHRWPLGIGALITAGAVICIAATWYAEHSPDDVFDLFEDYCEKLISYLFLPWVVGAIVGAVWLII